MLPDDLPLYRLPDSKQPIDPDTFEIADATRMSMSIPYFFEPVELIRDQVRISHQGSTDYAIEDLVDRPAIERLNAELKQQNREPAVFEEIDDEHHMRALIVDGGTLSNFPVWLFDVPPDEAPDPNAPKGPQRMTFGFTLRGGRGVGAGFNEAVKHMPWLFRFGFDIFHTAQEAWDTRFVSHSTRVRTIAVDAGNVGTTDFDIDEPTQNVLVDSGRKAAANFLDHFDPAQYVNTFHAKPA